MKRVFFYHMYADGACARNFIVCEEDYRYVFNLIGICSFLSGAVVLAFSIEDTHPHILLRGTYMQVIAFKSCFERSVSRHIAATRGTLDGVVIDCMLDHVEDEEYLKNVAAYVIIQPTKDGKSVMYHDYRWGTGCMYFRTDPYVPVWLLDSDCNVIKPVKMGDMKSAERKAISSRVTLPQDWLVVDGLILPQNYVDVKAYESIFGTHNCYRTFVGAGRKKLMEVNGRMAVAMGVMMDDLEAREKCRDLSKRLFGTRDVRRLDVQRRMRLAAELMNDYRLSYRQLATLVRLPESEIRMFLK
ncbi:MAG: hypothetical protein KBT08_02050 [Bacteroidales bacterium]|nr:hypothetical protein [Candidatus Cryptobacteroides onthequi]